MSKENYVTSSEEINNISDPANEIWGGKKMWEIRINKLNDLIDNLLTTNLVILLLSYLGFIINFAVGILWKADNSGKIIPTLFMTCSIQIAIA